MTETEEIEKAPPGAITDRQRAIYDWVVDYCETNGYSPTIRELRLAFGFRSNNSAMCHLHPLRKKGWLTWHPFKGRTIRPIGGLK
jgi:SOS-response transcriptional repressor LexA